MANHMSPIAVSKNITTVVAAFISLALTGCNEVSGDDVLQQTDTYKVVCQKSGAPWGVAKIGKDFFSGPVAMRDGHPFIFLLGAQPFDTTDVRPATCDEARQPLYFAPRPKSQNKSDQTL